MADSTSSHADAAQAAPAEAVREDAATATAAASDSSTQDTSAEAASVAPDTFAVGASVPAPGTSATASAPASPLRVALVTGASSGLGREFARQIDLLQQCDELWLVARNEEALREVAAKLTSPARILIADLGTPAGIERIRTTLATVAPDVRYLVNAAGFGKFGDWQTISDAAVDAMIDLNCRALVDVTQAALPFMGRGSRLIEIASAAAFSPLPHMNVYAATKAFVLHYTRALRWELHGSGITVTALCPTWVKTGFESVARHSGGGGDIGRLAGAQTPATVVSRALCANRLHLAVACASPQSAALRVASKLLPASVTMAGWNLVRHL